MTEAMLCEGLRLVESLETEEAARLTALQEAAHIGIADINAGRYLRFDSADEFSRHLASLANKTLDAARRPAGSGRFATAPPAPSFRGDQ